MESHLSKREKKLFSLPERLCLFDLTNTYFEGKATNNPKASRGHSKEKRTDCKLITLALIVDESGFAKYSQLYPGNQYEGRTLVEMIESLTKVRPDLASDRTVVIDAGIANEENIQYLHANKFHYIVVDRGNVSDMDTGDMKTIREDKNGVQVEVKRYEKEGEVYLLCRSAGGKEKDKSIRTRQEDIFLERVKFYQGGLGKKGRTKRYSKIIEMIGRLREKYPRASKVYDIEVIPADAPSKDKSVHAKEIIYKKREGYEEAGKRDGCYLLRTDRNDLSDKEIWETYVMLTRVEKAFRNLKSSLGLRPNFHQKEKRADAHMFISVLAYHILHAIELGMRKTGDHRSWESIKAVLSTHQRLTIEYNQKTQKEIQRHHIRLCSNPEPEHKKIYKALGLGFIPLPRKFYTVQQ